MTIEGEDGFRTGVQRFSIFYDHRGGVLPDGTQRIGEEGDSRSGAASSLLPYPPRPPTPSPLTGLVWVRSHILRKVEGWRKNWCSCRVEKNPVRLIEFIDMVIDI